METICNCDEITPELEKEWNLVANISQCRVEDQLYLETGIKKEQLSSLIDYLKLKEDPDFQKIA